MATLRTLRSVWLTRVLLCVVAASLAGLQISPAYAMDVRLRRETARQLAWHLAHMPHVALAPGLTQTPDAALQKKIAAKAAAQAQKPVADVRPLTAAEMGGALGRGPLRNPYFNGTLPWQKSLRDVNLCNGNLFKSFTDVQVAPAQGAGLVLQRTYNSNDARVGPFGVGWTHAYDIRIQEASSVSAESGNLSVDNTTDNVPRTDFFGAKHTYHRDADGLYSPPPYLYDETKSDYGTFLSSGPPQVLDDSEKGMDGTIKHYTNIVTKADGRSGNERACDYIQDRYGNTTTLTYGQSYVQPDGSTRKMLTQVADPIGRTLTFQWTNFGTASQPIYRITEVDAPTDPGTGQPVYKVVYAYYTDASDPNAGGLSYQLKSVTLDPDGLSRTTTYTYTSCAGTYYDAINGPQSATEYGLLASVSDPLGHTVSYTYSATAYISIGETREPPAGTIVPKPKNTVWVSTVTEPAGMDAGGNPRTQTWTIVCVGGGGPVNSIVTSSAGAYFFTTCDSQLRTYQYFDAPLLAEHRTLYDDDNNAYYQLYYNQEFPVGQNGWHADSYTYGQHGNMLTHQFRMDGTVLPLPRDGGAPAFPGMDTTTYYNASQYFAKQSVTDMDGHTTTMGVGTSAAGTPGDVDTNIGDRGQTLWVQDAGYNDAGSPSFRKQFTYTYNSYGQKLTETNLNGVVTQYIYGSASGSPDLGNLIQVVQDPGGAGHLNRTTTMHYDIMGRVLQSTDPAGQTSTFTYNSLGQPKTVSTPAKGVCLAETISYAYDTNGRTLSVTDNRGTTTMIYETGCDRVRSVQDPVTGTISYTYLASGERTAMTLPGGGTWTYAYTGTTAASGYLQVPMPYPSDNGHYNHTDEGGPYIQIQGAWDIANGDPDTLVRRLYSVTDDQGRTVSYGINGLRQVVSADCNQVYTAQGNAQGTRVAYQETQSYNDSEPGITSQGGPFGRGWLVQTQTTYYTQNASQQPIQRIVSENDYGTDNMGQRQTNTSSVQVVNSDGSGHVDSNNNPVMTSRTESYTYDALNRLKTVDYGDGETQGYSFDAMGNRLQKTDSVGSTAGTTTSTYDAANRLTGTTGAGASTYKSDADGNTLTGGGRTNTWDSQNRLVSCTFGGTTSTFKYGADGLRRSSTVNGITTDYVYDGTMMVREGHASGGSLTPATITATYLIGPRGPEYRRDDTQTELDSQNRTVSKCRWYVYDGLGSVVGEMDPSGSMTSSPKYDVYGLVRSNSGTASSAMGFVGGLGHLSEASTGLIYMKARYYDPSLGRFNSQDSKCNGENWFIYCGNNPVNNTDADGKDSIPELLGYIGQFMLSALTCKTFQISLATMFLATLACILAPVAFVVGCGIPFGGLCGGAALSIMTVQAISAMMATLAASPGVGAVGKFPMPEGIYGPVMEIYNTIAGYAAGLDLIMAADDAYQQLT